MTSARHDRSWEPLFCWPLLAPALILGAAKARAVNPPSPPATSRPASTVAKSKSPKGRARPVPAPDKPRAEKAGEGAGGNHAAGPPRALTLQTGQGLVVELHGMKKVAVANPEVADVRPISRGELLVIAKSAGGTSLYIWDDTGRSAYAVTVADPPEQPPTVENLEPVVNRLRVALADPRIKVTAVKETVFLEGMVTDQALSDRAEAMANALSNNVRNLIIVKPIPEPTDGQKCAQALVEAFKGTRATARALADDSVLIEGSVDSEEAELVRSIAESESGSVTLVDALRVVPKPRKQVLLRARIVDINHNRLKDLGVDWGHVINGTVVDQPFMFGMMKGTARELAPFGARLDLLVTENAARILSEPNLLVVEGEEGSILVGGEFPVPVVQNQAGIAGAITVDYREYGVKLNVSPIEINGDDLVLKVAPEVSVLDLGNAVTASGFELPALRSRKAESTVRVHAGTTLAIGGLLQNNESRAEHHIPLLSRLPLVGNLFRSKSLTRDESELVILITPELVDPAKPSPASDLEKLAPKFEIPPPSVPGAIRPRLPGNRAR